MKIKRYFGKPILATDPNFSISSGFLAENFRRWHSSTEERQRHISVFLDWCNKPYEDLEEEDFRNYLIYLVNEERLRPATINNRNGSIRFFLVVILGKNVNYMRTSWIHHVSKLADVWSKEEVERFVSVVDDPRYWSRWRFSPTAIKRTPPGSAGLVPAAFLSAEFV